MSQAKIGGTVKIHYTGTLEDGTEFDSSAGREPLEFEIGSGQVIPGFDSAVDGMTVGENKTVTIPAAEAYGDRHDQLVQDVPMTALPEDMKPEVGMQLQSQNPDGQIMNLLVTEVGVESVTLDGNHPLAGQALTFAIELVEVA